MIVDEKFNKLKDRISGLGNGAVAFSGGVDSSFLAKVCFDVLGEKSAAITVVSPMLPESEVNAAQSIASSIGIKHILVREDIIDGKVAENPPERCYFCKKIEFAGILKSAHQNGFTNVFDGSNIDDLTDYRPGLMALAELQIISPLRDAELDKKEIRELSRRMNLPTWDKPAFACLASRIPYGERITREKLSRIERAEDYLRTLGLLQFRVRAHGDIARIEVAPNEREKLFDLALMDKISAELKQTGFVYVSLELEGYKTGSLNKQIPAMASK